MMDKTDVKNADDAQDAVEAALETYALKKAKTQTALKKLKDGIDNITKILDGPLDLVKMFAAIKAAADGAKLAAIVAKQE
jgi:hypothetical protein